MITTYECNVREYCACPDSKVHGANMGPTWALSVPGGPHVGPMNLAIRVYLNVLSANLRPHCLLYIDVPNKPYR